MTTRFVTALIAAMLFSSVLAQANDDFQPSRFRLVIHDGYKLGDNLDLRAHFIPAGNLIGGLAPRITLGLGIKAASWLLIEPNLGWGYATDEPIVAGNTTVTFGRLSGWADAEFQFPSQSEYWFANLDYKFFGRVELGAEAEGWGSFKDNTSWSWGGGPNLFLWFGKMRWDTALHCRELNGSAKPELVMRALIFL